MARLFDDASSQKVVGSSAPVTAAPMTMCCWARPDVDLQTTAFAINDSGVQTSYFLLQLDMNVGGDPVAFYAGDGSSFTAAQTGTIVPGTWAHICGVARSATDRSVYFNGGSRVNSTTSRVPTNLNSIGIGLNNRPSTPRYFSGDLAECAVWDTDLNDDEIAALGKGISPILIRPGNLVFYAPLVGNNSPESDLVGGISLTVTGATKSNHPRIFYPSIQRTIHKTPVINAAISGAKAAATAAGIAGSILAVRIAAISGVLSTVSAVGFAGTVSAVRIKNISGALSTVVAAGIAGSVSAQNTKNIAGALSTVVATGLTGVVTALSGRNFLRFRFRDDDGNETTASWLAAENTNVTRSTETNTRLRTQMDTNIDAPAEGVKLQYRKQGSTDWNDVL